MTTTPRPRKPTKFSSPYYQAQKAFEHASGLAIAAQHTDWAEECNHARDILRDLAHLRHTLWQERGGRQRDFWPTEFPIRTDIDAADQQRTLTDARYAGCM